MSISGRALIIIFLLGTLVVLPSVAVVEAQSLFQPPQSSVAPAEIEETPPPIETTEELPSDGVIGERQEYKAQLTELNGTYRTQLEKYRNLERQFDVTKGQWQKVGSLGSLEAAVKATKEVMIARSEVLTTYLTLLRLEVLQTTGINVIQKEALLSDLDGVMVVLAAHQEKLQNIASRNEVNAQVAEFVSVKKEVERVSYTALTLLEVGRLQAVYDKLNDLTGDIRENTQANSDENNALVIAQQQRALDEIQTKLDEVHTELQEITAFTDKSSDRESKSVNDTVSRDLNKVYTGLSQAVGFLREFLGVN
ncbi:MAG TPA: hypothetical protein VD999_05070 [Vitreimonas sp.]|nr:hypothetical protein [Vitreimonas sp.]